VSTADLRVALVGPGAIGQRHLVSLRLAGAEVGVVVGKSLSEAEEFAAEHDIDSFSDDLDDVLARSDVDAVVIASPSQVHAAQMSASLKAEKPVLCEIPCALSATEAEDLAALADRVDCQAMVCHTFRFAEPYRALHDRVVSGVFAALHIVGTQLSLRHENIGWTGRQRDWVDDVLWHHGGHLFDTALWLLDAPTVQVHGTVGPTWPGSGRYMDTSALLVSPDGGMASLSLSYHSRVTVGTILIVGENETYQLQGGTLTCNGDVVVDCGDWDTMMREAQAAQDREFVESIRERRRPSCSIHDVMPTMRVLQSIAAGGPGADPARSDG
jgi:2-hydroxy-4-carboxymuconate semialdehyde hemiacetal dehydrogenase